MKTSRRTARSTSKAQREFRHYCSAYRLDARQQNVAPIERYTWLRTVAHGTAYGAGLLAWMDNSNPLDAHEAALRVLAQYAPGLMRVDPLELRADLHRVMAATGKRAPYVRLRHV